MPEIRYQLVTEDGETVDGAGEGVVEVPEEYPVAKFLERVYENDSHILKETALLNFKVYRDKASLQKGSQDLTILNGLGDIGAIPLLVVVPSEKKSTKKRKDVPETILWKDESPQRKSLLNRKRLHFFNRVEATNQLLSVHEKTYARAGDWEVPICAADHGSGKSSFAREYISLISELPEKAQRDFKVASILKGAVTVHVSLKYPDPDQTECLAAQILTLIKKKIASKVAQEIDFETFPDSLVAFMQKFIEASGRPFFLVLDEVSRPFVRDTSYFGRNDATQLTGFKEFIQVSISELLKIKGLFLLLCAGNRFLNWVGAMPKDRVLATVPEPIKATRIVLNMIRPAGIIEILQNTLVKSGDEMVEETVTKFLNLEGSNRVALGDYAENLFQLTAGHPKTLADTLHQRCMEIIRCKVPLEKRLKFEPLQGGLFASNAAYILDDTATELDTITQRLLTEYGRNRASFKLTDVVDGYCYACILPLLRIAVQELSDGSVRLIFPESVRFRLAGLVSPLHSFLGMFGSLK
jgi:hypothetical protein